MGSQLADLAENLAENVAEEKRGEQTLAPELATVQRFL